MLTKIHLNTCFPESESKITVIIITWLEELVHISYKHAVRLILFLGKKLETVFRDLLSLSGIKRKCWPPLKARISLKIEITIKYFLLANSARSHLGEIMEKMVFHKIISIFFLHKYFILYQHSHWEESFYKIGYSCRNLLLRHLRLLRMCLVINVLAKQEQNNTEKSTNSFQGLEFARMTTFTFSFFSFFFKS